MAEDYRTNRHAVFKLVYHAVLVTKYRRKAISPEMMAFMKEYARHLIDDCYDGVFVDLNGEPDHIHVLFELPATVAPAIAVGNLKTQLSKKIREKFSTEFQDILWGESFWSDSYFITTTRGASIATLERYIEQQGNPKPKRKYTRRKPTNTSQAKH